MNCPKCNESILDNYKFYGNCGYKVESQYKTCTNPECKRTGLPPEAFFCPECGKKLTGSFADFTETVNGVDIEMVEVEGGTFQMGSEDGDDDEKPVHPVRLSHFLIGKYPVTQKQWKAVMDNNPSDFEGDDHPVESVSWDDCIEFIEKLNRMTKKIYRLPTEAEWEYAARGGNKSRGMKYSGSDKLYNVGWYDGNADDETHPVGTKNPNELGIHDMSGNVWEWCNDWFDWNYYRNSPIDNPQGPSIGDYKIRRGGSIDNSSSNCRTTRRYYGYIPSEKFDYLGFRLALSSQ